MRTVVGAAIGCLCLLYAGELSAERPEPDEMEPIVLALDALRAAPESMPEPEKAEAPDEPPVPALIDPASAARMLHSIAPTSATCEAGALCQLGGRSYRFQPPSGWDGETPLPVLIHFHGRKRNSAHPLKNPRVAGPADDLGVLLIAPDGVDKDWFAGPDQWRDVAFVDALARDAARHVPIDRDRVFLSGFSNGGAMAARIACARGSAFAGYLPIAGYIRGGATSDCVVDAPRVLEVQGTTDQVYKPLPVGLGKVPRAVADEAYPFWRSVGRCDDAPEAEAFHVYECRYWRGCDGPRDDGEVGLCLHRYGHLLPKSWLPFALAKLLRDTEQATPAP